MILLEMGWWKQFGSVRLGVEVPNVRCLLWDLEDKALEHIFFACPDRFYLPRKASYELMEKI